jgi:hypothetical protein
MFTKAFPDIPERIGGLLKQVITDAGFELHTPTQEEVIILGLPSLS